MATGICLSQFHGIYLRTVMVKSIVLIADKVGGLKM